MKICLYQFTQKIKQTCVENGFVYTVVVGTGPDIPKQSEVMNGHNEDLKTTNQNFETSRDCEHGILLPSKETQSLAMMSVL